MTLLLIIIVIVINVTACYKLASLLLLLPEIELETLLVFNAQRRRYCWPDAEHSAELYEQYSNLMHVAKLRLVTIVYIRSQKIEIHGKN